MDKKIEISVKDFENIQWVIKSSLYRTREVYNSGACHKNLQQTANLSEAIHNLQLGERLVENIKYAYEKNNSTNDEDLEINK